MIGIDKIEITRLENGDRKIRFTNKVDERTQGLYAKLGVEPTFKAVIALEITLTEAEYHGIFVQCSAQ